MDSPDNSRVTTKTVALVGHSAAGKSTCFIDVYATLDSDMDVAFGTRDSPPIGKALDWLTAPSRPAIVVVSNHKEMLKALISAKRSGEYPEKLGAIHFVYLSKPKERLKSHLSLPTAGGSSRPQDNQESILKQYDRFHSLFTDLADEVIDCSTASTAEIAQRVREIAEHLGEVRTEKAI